MSRVASKLTERVEYLIVLEADSKAFAELVDNFSVIYVDVPNPSIEC